MKYEFLIRVKDHILSPFYDTWRGIVSEFRYDDVKSKFEKKLGQMVSSGQYYDVWLLINKLDDNGDFIEVIQ